MVEPVAGLFHAEGSEEASGYPEEGATAVVHRRHRSDWPANTFG